MNPKLKEMREFVNKKKIERPTRQPVRGDDLAKMHALIDKVPDEFLRQELKTRLSLHSKYVAIDMILNESSDIMQRHPELALQIAIAGTDLDRMLEHDPPAV